MTQTDLSKKTGINHRPKHLTQAECAKLANISRDIVIRIESGKNTSLESFKKYLDVCNKEMVIIDKRIWQV